MKSFEKLKMELMKYEDTVTVDQTNVENMDAAETADQDNEDFV